MSNRPLLTSFAEEVSSGTELTPSEVLTAFELLLPLLKLCAGDDPAGWLAGKGAIFRTWAAQRRERLCRARLAARGVRGAAADRTVAILKRVAPADVRWVYREVSS